jgi:hypothetical protein
MLLLDIEFKVHDAGSRCCDSELADKVGSAIGTPFSSDLRLCGIRGQLKSEEGLCVDTHCSEAFESVSQHAYYGLWHCVITLVPFQKWL